MVLSENPRLSGEIPYMSTSISIALKSGGLEFECGYWVCRLTVSQQKKATAELGQVHDTQFI